MAAASLQETVGQKLLRRASAAWYATRLYALTLPRQAPLELPVLPDEAWPGSVANADRLFQGRFVFAGVEVVSPRAAPWGMTAAELKLDAISHAAWAAELHGFRWLRDFVTQGGDMARRMARALVGSWLEKHAMQIQGLPWRADVAGRRLAHWVNAAHFLLDGADDKFAHDFLLAIARHTAHLNHAAKRTPPGLPRFAALLGLVYGTEALGQPQQAVMQALCGALETQILADGGHVSRNPSQLYRLLREIVALWRFLLALDPGRAALLQVFLDRMAPMLRFFRHGDGGLALFHGGQEETPAQIDQLLDLSDAKGKPLNSATLSGYERALARRGLLLIDTGAMPPMLPDAPPPHRGLLSFEFSHGKDRLIVNCGASRRVSGGWSDALSGSAAHSTITLGQDEPATAARISATRNEQDGAIWFDLEHDGWWRSHNRLHRRRLFLAAGGEDLRGEETITESPASANGGMPVEAVLRLHLHPGVHASLIGSGDTVILKSASGQGWRWRGAGGVVRLEDSVYFGHTDNGGADAPRRTQQIVMTGSAGETPLVFKWALSKIG